MVFVESHHRCRHTRHGPDALVRAIRDEDSEAHGLYTSARLGGLFDEEDETNENQRRHTRRRRAQTTRQAYCMRLPGSEEKLSHGEPTWFVRKKVFVMFANNHHNDGHIAVWLPALPGMQASLIASFPKTFFRPPYVGVKGWVGIELARVSDDELVQHIHEAWKLIAPKSLTS